MPLFVLLLTGCASMSRQDVLSQQEFPSLADALIAVAPIGQLEKGKAETIKISPKKSPKATHEGTQDFFEIVTLQGTEGEPFRIETNALCDCLGMPKWVVNPRLYLFDAEGNVIAESPAESDSGLLSALVDGSYPATGTYKLVLLAESKHHRMRTGSVPGYMNGVQVMSIPMTIRETGKLVVMLH